MVSGCYEYANDGMLKRYTCDDSVIIIPSEIDGVTIKKIESYAFDNDNIKDVVLPSTISYVANSAFSLNSLENVLFEGEDVTIDYEAFSPNMSLDGINLYYVGKINWLETNSSCVQQSDQLLCNYYDDVMKLYKVTNFIRDENYIDEESKYSVEMEEMFGIETMSVREIDANVILSDKVEQSFSLTNIKVRNLDSNYNVVIDNVNADVIIVGTESNISNLNENNIELYVDLDGYEIGEYEVTIKVEVDNKLVLAVVKPPLNKVKVEIIKK